MKLLTWLLARLRQPPPLAPTATPTAVAAPTPTAPPTEAERLAQAPQRQAHIEQVLTQGQAAGLSAIQGLPVGLQRLLVTQNFAQADLATARTNGWWAEELRLQLEVQQLEADIQHQAWQHSLITDHGEKIGRKLAQHQVEVGMTLKQLFASYGEPPAGGITYDSEDPDLWFIQYGSEPTGSYFEQRDGVVTLARLGTPELPGYVRNNMRELGC